MKKAIFAVLLCMIGCHAFSQINMVMKAIQIQWSVRYEQPVGNGNPVPRSPIVEPEVTLDGHTLYLCDLESDVTIQLFDEDNVETYSVFIPEGTSTVQLPSTLTGNFQIQLHNGSIYYFVGEIVL